MFAMRGTLIQITAEDQPNYTVRSFPWASPSPKIAQQNSGETTHDAFPRGDIGITLSLECPELCTNCLRDSGEGCETRCVEVREN